MCVAQNLRARRTSPPSLASSTPHRVVTLPIAPRVRAQYLCTRTRPTPPHHQRGALAGAISAPARLCAHAQTTYIRQRLCPHRVPSCFIPSINISTAVHRLTAGKVTTTSTVLDLGLDFDLNALFTLARVPAVEACESTAQTDGVVPLVGRTRVKSTNADSVPPTMRELDEVVLAREIQPAHATRDTAFKGLRSDVFGERSRSTNPCGISQLIPS